MFYTYERRNTKTVYYHWYTNFVICPTFCVRFFYWHRPSIEKSKYKAGGTNKRNWVKNWKVELCEHWAVSIKPSKFLSLSFFLTSSLWIYMCVCVCLIFFFIYLKRCRRKRKKNRRSSVHFGQWKREADAYLNDATMDNTATYSLFTYWVVHVKGRKEEEGGWNKHTVGYLTW